MTASGWHRKNPNTPAQKRADAKYSSAEHRKQRAQRVAAATPATRCTCPGKPLGCKQHAGQCPKSLGPDSSKWHTPHRRDGVSYWPGLWCQACNASDGASQAARARNAKRRPPPPRAARDFT